MVIVAKGADTMHKTNHVTDGKDRQGASASGHATAEKMRRRELLDDEEAPRQVEGILEGLNPEEARHLNVIVEELSPPEARDPKTAAVTYFLREHGCEGKIWLEHGCIIFSQYSDRTARWRLRWLTPFRAWPLPVTPVRARAGSIWMATSHR